MDNGPTTVQVPSPPRRGSSIVVLVGTALVALAILKPWTLGAPTGSRDEARSTGLASPTAPPSSPTAIPTEAISDPNGMACMSSEGDRLLALLRAPGVEVRTWLTLDSISLVGPLDPAAVPLRLPSSHVIGLGICARRIVQNAGITSAAQLVDVTLVSMTDAPKLRDLGAPQVISQQLGIPTLGILYGPPAALAPPAALTPLAPHASMTALRSAGPEGSQAEASLPLWPPGDYALAFRFAGDPETVVRWIRLDLVPAVGKYG